MAAPPPICGPCQDQRNRWLDSRPSQVLPRFGFTYGAGARYDATVAGINDNRRSQFERWRELVRFERDLIARTCREAGHVAAGTPAPQDNHQPVTVELPGISR